VPCLVDASCLCSYLGLVRAHLSPNSSVRRTLLSAMIARAMKNRLREQLRHEGSAPPAGAEAGVDRGVVFRRTAVSFFNLILGHAQVGGCVLLVPGGVCSSHRCIGLPCQVNRSFWTMDVKMYVCVRVCPRACMLM